MPLPAPLPVPTPALPTQDPSVPWPVPDWPLGAVPPGVDLEPLLAAVMDPEGACRTTLAVVVIHRGQLVAERYGGHLEFFDRPAEPVDATTPLLSWSMAKSMTQAMVYQQAAEGRLELTAPPGVPEWAAPGDPRGEITLDELLAMRDGLDFSEDYVDEGASDVIEMLFGSGKDDVAHFAASKPLAFPPGTHYSYSSGTTNIISGVLARLFGPGEPYRRALTERLFQPLAMDSADPGFDAAGTFIGSSYVHATARDFAKFGLCYLRGGVFNDRQVVPTAAVTAARTPLSKDDEGALYSSQWWMLGDEFGTFYCSGYDGQSISCVPALDLVVVRLGRTPVERSEALRQWRRQVFEAFAAVS